MAEPSPRLFHRAKARGQPLVFLLTILCVWSAARIAYHWPSSAPASALRQLPTAFSRPIRSATPVMTLAAASRRQTTENAVTPMPTGLARIGMAKPAGLPLAVAMAHQKLWMESLVAVPGGDAQRPSPAAPLLDPLLMPPDEQPEPPMRANGVPVIKPGRSRWSVYGWSLVRQGSGTRALAPAAQYGGSQAGLLVRYALADSPDRPLIYARATGALGRSDDRMLAIGLAARPVAAWPLDLAVERRMALGTRQRGQFAVMAVAGGEARRGDIRMEAYGQAGLVGLADPVGFFDLHMLATRKVHQTDTASVALGGGIWAGGQQNPDEHGGKPWGYRVDIGPRAAMTLPVDGGTLALALDWRQRVDGDARPVSGAALTLSAGF